MGIHGWSAKLAAKSVGNIGRKFMTAFAKKTRPKTGSPKPMSDAWRMENMTNPSAKTKNALTKHYYEASQANEASWARRAADYDAGYPKAKKPKAPQKRVSFKGQDMTEKNFQKSFKTVGGYKYGTIVSKEAMRTSRNVKYPSGRTGIKKALDDAYGPRGFRNYKTRSYER